MAFDFKKGYKEFYMPKNRPEIVQVPKANYIAVRGSGDPNEAGGACQQASGVINAHSDDCWLHGSSKKHEPLQR